MKKQTHIRTGKEKIKLSAIAFLFVLLIWAVILYFFTPNEIIQWIGINNGYLISCLAGLLGGTSLFFPFPHYLFLVTFGAGGLNPFLLGLMATLGVFIGESTSYFIGHTSHLLFAGKTHSRLHSFKAWISHQSQMRISFLLFIIGCVPIPNDIIIVPLGLLRYSYWKTMIPLALGNLVYNIAFASIGYYGWYVN